MLLILLIVIVVIIIISAAVKAAADNELLQTVTSTDRGERSERKLILNLLKQDVPANQIFHDLYIPRGNRYSQVDAVIVSNVGIIVFEVKDYSGWIFGKGYQDYWTQVLNFGKEKYRFYNPIKQNEGHIKAIKQFIGQEDIPFFSVVVFYGDSEFKDVSGIPNNTYVCYPNHVREILRDIKQYNAPCRYMNAQAVLQKMQHAMELGESQAIREIHAQHAQQIRDLKQPPHNISWTTYIPRFRFHRRRRRRRRF